MVSFIQHVLEVGPHLLYGKSHCLGFVAHRLTSFLPIDLLLNDVGVVIWSHLLLVADCLVFVAHLHVLTSHIVNVHVVQVVNDLAILTGLVLVGFVV